MKDKNSIISQLRHEYDIKQRRAKYMNERDKKEFYDKYPYILHIDNSIGETYLEMMKDAIDANSNKKQLKEKIEKLKQEKLSYIKLNNVDMSALDMKYECEKCKDTGYIIVDGQLRNCQCFEKRYKAIVYEMSELRDLTAKCSFDSFDIKLFSDEAYDINGEKIEISPRGFMRKMRKISEDFAENFQSKDEKSMIFTGKTGLGKTFLALCIAERLLSRSKSVIYETSVSLFEKLEKTVFNRGDDRDREFYDMVYDCDLLIIDDLGTEIVNEYINSQLFNIVNKRVLQNKKMIISTNLSPSELLSRYERRITSRLFDTDEFETYKFIGRDLRWSK